MSDNPSPQKPSLFSALKKAKSSLFSSSKSSSSSTATAAASSSTGKKLSLFSRASSASNVDPTTNSEALTSEKLTSTNSALAILKRVNFIAEETLKQPANLEAWYKNLALVKSSLWEIGENAGKAAGGGTKKKAQAKEMDAFVEAQKKAVDQVLRFLKDLVMEEGVWKEEHWTKYADDRFEELGKGW